MQPLAQPRGRARLDRADCTVARACDPSGCVRSHRSRRPLEGGRVRAVGGGHGRGRSRARGRCDNHDDDDRDGRDYHSSRHAHRLVDVRCRHSAARGWRAARCTRPRLAQVGGGLRSAVEPPQDPLLVRVQLMG